MREPKPPIEHQELTPQRNIAHQKGVETALETLLMIKIRAGYWSSKNVKNGKWAGHWEWELTTKTTRHVEINVTSCI